MRLFSASVTFGLLLAALLVVHPCHGQNWTTETIDMGIWFDISTHAVAFDTDGHPHVVYAGKKLYYQHHDGQRWIREIVLDSDVELLQPSIILDRDSIPHIVYFKFFEGSSSTNNRYELWHAWYRYDRWVSERIAESIALCEIPMAVSSDNYIHILFFDWYYSKGVLVHAVRNLVTWITDPIQSEASIHFCAMNIGTDDVIRVFYSVYHDYTDMQLRLATKSSDYWQFETLAQMDPDYGQMVIDDGGKIHLCYGYSATTGDLYYMTQSGDTWITEQVSDDTRLTNAAIYSNAENEIVIGGVVSSDTASKLTIFTKENESWNSETIDTGMDYDHTTTWAMDTQDHPCVLGIRNLSGELMLGRRVGWQWIFEKLDNRGGAGTQVIAQRDQSQKIRILYSYNGVNQLRYAIDDGDNWNIQILEDGLGSTNELGLCIDSQNRSHLCYFSKNSMQLKYLYEEMEGWNREIVDGGTDIVGISIALSPSQLPRMLYIKDGSLILARKLASGEWSYETVSEDASVAADLAIGSNGVEQIIFYSGDPSQQPVYGEKSNGAWEFRSLGDTLSASYECSIFVDAYNHPHICYMTYNYQGCPPPRTMYHYGRYTNDTWEIFRIQSDSLFYYYSDINARSMGFDRDGNPIVAALDDDLVTLHFCDQMWWPSFAGSDANPGWLLASGGQIDLFSNQGMRLQHCVRNQPEIGVRLEMPHDFYSDWSRCWLQAALSKSNPSGTTDHLVVCLEYAGQFWFYPSWSTQFAYIDVPMDTHLKIIEIIEEFSWPEDLGFHANGLFFWGALLDDSMTQILGGDEGIGSWEFSF